MSFSLERLSVTVFADAGASVSLTSILNAAFGSSWSNFQDFWITSQSADVALTPYNFSYWDPAHPSVPSWTVNGTAVPHNFENQRYVPLSNVGQVNLVAGNSICDTIFLSVQNGPSINTQYTIKILPTIVQAPADLAIDPADIVASAMRFNSAFSGIPNPNDCGWITDAIGGAAGAALPFLDQSIVPGENREGGFWRIVHRGSENALADWQSIVQPGDIVRFDWADPSQPQHTTLIMGTQQPDGTIQVFDNGLRQAGVPGTFIGLHAANYDAYADAKSVTVYRVTPDHLYLVQGTEQSEKLVGTANNDDIRTFGGNDTIFASIGNDVIQSGTGNDTVYGEAGNDKVTGGLGDDTIDGGAGDDTAVFTQALANYSVRKNGTNITVSGPDGNDVLSNIEQLRFADIAINLNAGDSIVTAPGGSSNFDGGAGNDIISFNFNFSDATVSLSGNHVIVDGPSGSHTVLTGFETFVFTDGTVNDNDGDPLVDDLFYYSHNRDVWNAHVDADQHYHQSGWHEGRDPNAFFSTSFYLSLNQDVKKAGVDPLAHFDQAGWREGRQPSAAFDDAAYLAANPDVAAARIDPLAHFLQSGQGEGRQATALTSLIGPHGFDSVFYLQHNPDVQAAQIDPFQHYQNFGWKEGRNPNALFDSKGYLTANPDVANAHINPLDHYDQFGWREGRDPSTAFDTTEYLSHYSDVAAAHIDPLVHYLQHGIHEGRQTFADGLWV